MQPLTRPHLGRSASLVVAALVGVLIGLGMAPMGIWPATIVGVALFTWLLGGRSGGDAAVHGLVAGAALNTLTLHWISVLGVPVAVALIAFMSLWFMLMGVATTLLTRVRGWAVWVPAAWVALEFGMGSVPFGGFPWTRLSLTALDQPLAGWFAVIGAVGVSFLVALVAHLALVAWLDRERRVRGVAALVVVVLAGVALQALPHATPEQSVTVGVVQGNVNRDEKGTDSYASSVTNNHLSETIFLLAANRAGGDTPPDFIVWPENATDIDPVAQPAARSVVEAAVALAGVPILVGAVMEGPEPDTRQTSSLWWHPDSGPGARYDKRNLVPFGEWIPFRDVLLPMLPILEQIGRQSIPGEGHGVLEAPTEAFDYLTVGTIICFELAWDSTSHDTIRGGADVIISQSNTNTYAGTFEVPQQTALNRVRALETGREVIVSTLNGVSGLVTVDGRLVDTTRELTAAHRTFTVPLRTNTNLAVVVTPWLAPVLTAVALGALSWALVTASGPKRPGRLRG